MMLKSPSLSQASDAPVVTVGADLPLLDLVSKRDSLLSRFVLVRNTDGDIEGLVDVIEAERRLEAVNPVERARWEAATVASIAECVLIGGGAEGAVETDSSEPQLTDPVIVKDQYGCAAIVVGGQVYLCWERISGAISRNQIDPVTLLPTRRAFNRRLIEEFGRARRNQCGLAVVMIDIDHFKSINDRFGHATGDVALRAVGDVLRASIRSYDFVARFGGDEFAIIYSDCKPSSIDLPLSRLERDIRALPAIDEVAGVKLALSVGAAVMASVDESCLPSLLFEQADACLYQAKREGRGRSIAVELDPFGIPVSAPWQSTGR